MLIYFILGILFDEFILPLISSAAELCVMFFEKQKGKLAVDIAKMNKEVNDISEEINKEPVNTVAMGFHIPSNTEEDLEEDDDF